jgi:hypothetical protein
MEMVILWAPGVRLIGPKLELSAKLFLPSPKSPVSWEVNCPEAEAGQTPGTPEDFLKKVEVFYTM